MTPQTSPQPPKCCCFNIKTATVALGIFHMVSVGPGRGTGRQESRGGTSPGGALLWFMGFPGSGMFSAPKRKTQRVKRDGQKVMGDREKRNSLHWEGF